MTANTATINTATNTELSTPELLTNVRKAGRNVAKAFSVGIAAIQTASEHGVELSDIRGAYITGYMGDYLDCDDVKAQHYLSLPGYEQDAKDSDKRRTKTQEMAYGAARGWNRGVGLLDFEPTLFAEAASIVAEFRANHFHHKPNYH